MYFRRHWFIGASLAGAFLVLPISAVAQAASLPTKQNNEGQVMVSVTPANLPEAENWHFTVQLNTHVAPLTQNLAAVSTLGDGKGRDEKPLEWRGDAPGGHHVKGVLVFKTISPRPDSITLTIRQVGGVPERKFTWKLAGQ